MSVIAACKAGILAPGTKLGKYELVRRLAVGGMAELYLARASGIEGFEKLVALKRILPQYSGNDDFVGMLLDEARLVATLQHANIAQVYDIGQTADGFFFTMEYIDGEDVRNLLRTAARTKRRIPLEQVLSVVVGAAAGLHYAHEKTDVTGCALDIVHRDVSPSNVIVSYDGCVKLIDFGVAKASQRQTETRAGTLKGKISYMSPEQCEGRPLDRRSDVFSLGILLYELTTGQRLFSGDNEFGIMKQIVYQDVPPPSTRRASYPAELEAIVLKALARDASKRYPSAQALQLDLETFARTYGLAISSANLGRYMRDLFADRIAMRAAMDEDAASGGSHRIPCSDEADSASDVVIDVVHEVGDGPVATWMFDVPEVVRDAASGRLTTSPVSSCVSPVLPGAALGSQRRRWAMISAALVVAVAFGVGAAIVVGTGGDKEAVATPANAARPAALFVPVTLPAAMLPTQTATMPEVDGEQSSADSKTALDASTRTTPELKTKSKRKQKRSKKRSKKKKRRGWDPDSALPPPG